MVKFVLILVIAAFITQTTGSRRNRDTYICNIINCNVYNIYQPGYTYPPTNRPGYTRPPTNRPGYTRPPRPTSMPLCPCVQGTQINLRCIPNPYCQFLPTTPRPWTPIWPTRTPRPPIWPTRTPRPPIWPTRPPRPPIWHTRPPRPHPRPTLPHPRPTYPYPRPTYPHPRPTRPRPRPTTQPSSHSEICIYYYCYSSQTYTTVTNGNYGGSSCSSGQDVCHSGQATNPCYSSQSCQYHEVCCYSYCSRTSECSSGGGRYHRSTQINSTKLIETGPVNLTLIVRMFDDNEVYKLISEEILHMKVELLHLINVDVIPYTDQLDCGLSALNCLGGRLLSCYRNMTQDEITQQEHEVKLLSLAACLTQSGVELKERDVQASMLTMKMCATAQDLKWKELKSCMLSKDNNRNNDSSLNNNTLAPDVIVVINEEVVTYTKSVKEMHKKICEEMDKRGIFPNSCSSIIEE